MKFRPLPAARLRRLIPALCVCALATIVAYHSASASTIGFDPDGGDAGNGMQTVSVMDFRPGNSLYRGIGSLLTTKTDQPIEHYVQARMGTLLDANGDLITINGLDTGFELTLVIGFSGTATISAALPTITSYELAGAPTISYFKLYYDDTPDANDLAGTGFENGTLILDGTVNAASGFFGRATGNPQTVKFDNFGPDNFGNFQTRRIAGGADYQIGVTFAHGSFFDTLPPALSLVLYNTSDITPFNQVNPAGLFSDGNAATIVPLLGSVNGEGTDFQTQADANAAFVPEPSSFVLGALGMLGILALTVRRRSAS